MKFEQKIIYVMASSTELERSLNAVIQEERGYGWILKDFKMSCPDFNSSEREVLMIFENDADEYD